MDCARLGDTEARASRGCLGGLGSGLQRAGSSLRQLSPPTSFLPRPISPLQTGWRDWEGDVWGPPVLVPHVDDLSECSSAVRLPLTVEEGLPPSRPHSWRAAVPRALWGGGTEAESVSWAGGREGTRHLSPHHSQREMETASGVQDCPLRGWPHGLVTRKGQQGATGTGRP